MNKLCYLISLTSLLFSISCKSNQIISNNITEEKELETLTKLMTGEFSSSEQSQNDSLFYDINLVMFQIWKNYTKAKWLYVEQAATANIKKPYRQRVYKLSKVKNGLIESKVYELPTPSKYVHAWNEPNIFNGISADSLILRTGCAVYLEKEKDNCYSGSTKEKECKSTLRRAEYATSQVTICADQISSWDQGWDSNDNQVWGAETEGYIFKRTK